MSLRILVPLDGSAYSKTATDFAVNIVKENGGTVVGVGIIDVEEIEDSTIGAGVGASYYAEHLENFKINDALEKVRNFLGEFETTCKDAEVEFEKHSKSGSPFEQIVELGKTADVIITGMKTFYHFATTPEPGDTLKKVLESGVCPVFAVPAKLPDSSDNVLVTYDSSSHSARAMRLFTNLGIGAYKNRKVHILNINDDLEASEKILDAASDYMEAKGFKNIEKIRKVGTPNQEILKYAKEINACTIVMGAYGQSGLSSLFFGRTTLRIIEDGTMPIFAYH